MTCPDKPNQDVESCDKCFQSGTALEKIKIIMEERRSSIGGPSNVPHFIRFSYDLARYVILNLSVCHRTISILRSAEDNLSRDAAIDVVLNEIRHILIGENK